MVGTHGKYSVLVKIEEIKKTKDAFFMPDTLAMIKSWIIISVDEGAGND